MLFTSTVFLLFFLPLAVGAYYALSFSKTAQNICLFLFSLVFYAWAEPVYIFGLFFMIMINQIAGILIKKIEHSKWVLLLSIMINLSVLVGLKYIYFILNEVSKIIESPLTYQWNLSMPIGISFFTLRAISYLVDIYKNKILPTKNIIELGLYFAFFPNIIAGPLLSFEGMSEQIKHRQCTYRKVSVGVCRFVVGLSKKVILANTFASIATRIFDLSTIGVEIYSVPSLLAILGSFTFLLQIYFDFSGYCDMAIGLALIFGFKLPANFDYPLASKTVTEFWSRFNQTLFSWFEEYVSAPLSKRSIQNKDKSIKSMFISWGLIGLWHGAGWTFIFWGLINYLLILFEEFIKLKEINIRTILLRIYTICTVALGFTIFRAKDLYQAGIYIGNIFCANYNGFVSDLAWIYIKEYFMFYLVGILFCTPIAPRINEMLYEERHIRFGKVVTYFYPIAMTALFIISLAFIKMNGQTDFIFYRF